MPQRNETISLGAYHEAGRVFYAYKNGYTCGSIQLSETDSGGGVSSLNGGSDTAYIQAILSGKITDAVLQQDSAKAAEAAHKLMQVYCAGSCAELFYDKKGNTDEIDEIDLPAQDIKYIQLVQQYLQARVPGHGDDYPTATIMQIFEELPQPAAWKPITCLAEAILKEDGKLDRFGIEDALMSGGLTIQQPSRNASMQLTEADLPAPASEAAAPAANEGLNEEVLLDIVLKDFLKAIKKDWGTNDLNGSVDYLKGVFKEYYA